VSCRPTRSRGNNMAGRQAATSLATGFTSVAGYFPASVQVDPRGEWPAGEARPEGAAGHSFREEAQICLLSDEEGRLRLVTPLPLHAPLLITATLAQEDGHSVQARLRARISGHTAEGECRVRISRHSRLFRKPGVA